MLQNIELTSNEHLNDINAWTWLDNNFLDIHLRIVKLNITLVFISANVLYLIDDLLKMLNIHLLQKFVFINIDFIFNDIASWLEILIIKKLFKIINSLFFSIDNKNFVAFVNLAFLSRLFLLNSKHFSLFACFFIDLNKVCWAFFWIFAFRIIINNSVFPIWYFNQIQFGLLLI